MSSKFLYYWLSSAKRFAEKLASGTTFLEISGKYAGLIPFPLAPQKEQTRVVEKLEELLSDLDDGVAELKAAQTKLTQYRQSLLKSAVEGTLTEKWRSQNQCKITETGEQLLARILIKRRRRWEEQKLAEFKEKGRKPPKDWQKKYPEPVQPDTTGLPELPEGWVWASLDMLGNIVSGVTKGSKRSNSIDTYETPYLRVANVQRGYLDLDEIKTIAATKDDIERYKLEKGDILFNEGGDRDKLGRGWVWYGEIESCIHQNHVFRLRPYTSEIVPELISHYGNTFGKQWFQNSGKQTTNLASINKGILQSFPVPLSPNLEQQKILDTLTVELTNVDRQIQSVDFSLKESEAQRKNILKEAFSGKLVEQDPNDEPVSVLLERIRAERAARAKLPKAKRTKRKANHRTSIMETLLDILKNQDDWMDAQDAFRACGVTDGTDTDRIEELYAELRRLDKDGMLMVKRQGNYDKLKLKG